MCGICGKLDKNFLCKKCEIKLQKIAKFEETENFEEEKYFDKQLYIFKYEGIIRSSIIDYKFNEKSYLDKTFTNFILKNDKFLEILKSYDTIIPVPISSKRFKTRGYNQSYLIANKIAKKLKKECDIISLVKTKNIVEQSKLNKEQRQKNIQGVYTITSKKRIQGKNIILLDDIYTTGSTANECSKMLKQAGAKSITVFTIAKD